MIPVGLTKCLYISIGLQAAIHHQPPSIPPTLTPTLLPFLPLFVFLLLWHVTRQDIGQMACLPFRLAEPRGVGVAKLIPYISFVAGPVAEPGSWR